MNCLNELCYIGACTKIAEYICPQCDAPVCEAHTAGHICALCFEEFLRIQAETVEDVDFGEDNAI